MLQGVGGLVHGARAVLWYGGRLVVGRSRSCDLSLRRTDGFQSHPRRDRVILSRRFHRVSRAHCELHYRPDGLLEIRDRSHNGTLVDGKRVCGTFVWEPDVRPLTLEVCDASYGRILIQPALAAARA